MFNLPCLSTITDWVVDKYNEVKEYVQQNLASDGDIQTSGVKQSNDYILVNPTAEMLINIILLNMAKSMISYSYWVYKTCSYNEKVEHEQQQKLKSLNKEDQAQNEELNKAEIEADTVIEALFSRSKELDAIEREELAEIERLEKVLKLQGKKCSIQRKGHVPWEERAEKQAATRSKQTKVSQNSSNGLDSKAVFFSGAYFSGSDVSLPLKPSMPAIIREKAREIEESQQVLNEHNASMELAHKILDESEQSIIRYANEKENAIGLISQSHSKT